MCIYFYPRYRRYKIEKRFQLLFFISNFYRLLQLLDFDCKDLLNSMANGTANVIFNASVSASCCCVVCMELFDTNVVVPKILPCGHQFCENCLHILIVSSLNPRCPTCRTNFDGRLTFVTNFGLLGITVFEIFFRHELNVSF